MRQRVARDLGAAKTHVIEAWLYCSQTRLDITQTLAISQLCKSQCQELIQTRKAFHFVVAMVALHTAMELLQREQGHDLREHGTARIHAPRWHVRRSPFKSFPALNAHKQLNSLSLHAEFTSTLGH